MPDEFQTPKEFTKPSEFPKVKEVYVSSPEFLDRPVGYGTTGKSSKEGKSRSSNIRKMMMYLAASVTTMGTILGFSSAQPAKFDKKAFVQEHREWYCPDSDEYVYLGDNGWALIAKRSENGNYYDEFCHYNRMRYNIEDGSEYMFTAYGYDLDWTIKPIDSKKVPVWIRFVESDGSYTVEASDTADFKDMIKAVEVEPSKSDYPGKQYMLKYISYSMQDILNEFNTYVHEGDAPVYMDFDKITFNPDGTGVFLSGKKEHAFTYTTDEDPISGMITINYNGKTARANFFFDSAMPQMIFFDGLVGVGDSFAMFIATDPETAEEKISSNKYIKSGDNNLPTSPDDPKETKPSDEKAEPVDASYLMVKRDWYSKNLKTCIFFGESGTGYVFEKDLPDDGNFYSRFIYRISGSKCECELVRFEFQKMRYVTEKWTFTLMKVGDEIQLWSKSIVEKGEHQVFKECSDNLNCYVNRLAGTNTGTILLQYKKFNIVDNSLIVNGITGLEFTGKNSGIIRYNENGKSKKSTFTYNIESKDLDSVFYINYNGETYLGQIFYARSGPGITLFNPSMDGTHGKFVAG